MENPVTGSFIATVRYAGLWAGVAAGHAVLLRAGCGLGWGDATGDALVFSIVLALCLVPVWYPVRYGSMEGMPVALRAVAWGALAAVVIVVWLSVGYILMSGLFPETVPFLKRSMLWRVPEGVAAVAVAVLAYRLRICKDRARELAERCGRLEKREAQVSSVTVKDNKRIHIIPVEEISCIEADGDYVKIHSLRGVFLKEATMKWFADNLPYKQFVRVHRSYIVQVARVKGVDLYEKESYNVHLDSGETVRATAAGYRLLREVMGL